MSAPIPRPSPAENRPPRSERDSHLGQAPFPPLTLATAAVTGLFLISLLHTLRFARALFLPITLAVLLYLLLIPVVQWLKAVRLREPAGAALVMLLLVAVVAFGLYQLAEPAREWVGKLPSALQTLEAKLRPMQQSADQVNEATAALEEVAPGTETAPVVTVKKDWQLPLLQWSTEAVAEIGGTLVLLYFLLASGELFTHKLLTVLPDDEDRQRASQIIQGIERKLSSFFFHSMVQNAGVAGLFALILWALDMPNPALWGVGTLVLQFVPYLGTIAVVTVISLVAAVTFDEVWRAALPGLSYVTLMWIKGMLITPVFLGKRLELNPVAVLISLFLWGWIWGVAGTLLAVPIFAALKIVCDHIPRLHSLGQFLGR